MSHRINVSVLKILSKELLSLLKHRDLNVFKDRPEACVEVVSTLHLKVPHHLQLPENPLQQPLLVKLDESNHAVSLPLVSTDNKIPLLSSSIWGLTDQGLREQLMVYASSVGSGVENLRSYACDLMKKEKGIIFMHSRGDNFLWSKLFSCAHEQKSLHRLKVINCMTGDMSAPFPYKISHSLNLFSGMSASQLSEWLLMVSKSWQSSHVHLFEKLPSSYKSMCPIFADYLLQSSQKEQIFLTPKFIAENCQWDIFENRMPLLLFGKNNPSFINENINKKSDWLVFFELWKFFLSFLSDSFGHLFNEENPDFHLIEAIKKRDHLIILMPGFSSNTENYLALGNVMASSIYQAARHLDQGNHLQSVLMITEANFVVSPSIAQKLSSLRKSNMGVIWHTTNPHHEYPLVESIYPPATQMMMRFECNDIQKHTSLDDKLKILFKDKKINDLNHLREGQAYLISDQVDIPLKIMQCIYSPYKKVEHLFLPPCQSETYSSAGQYFKSENTAQKKQAQRLECEIQALLSTKSKKVSLSWCQETVAKMMGYAHWHEALSDN